MSTKTTKISKTMKEIIKPSSLYLLIMKEIIKPSNLCVLMIIGVFILMYLGKLDIDIEYHDAIVKLISK